MRSSQRHEHRRRIPVLSGERLSPLYNLHRTWPSESYRALYRPERSVIFLWSVVEFPDSSRATIHFLLQQEVGWSTIFYFTFVQKLTHPITAEPQLTVAQYQAVFSRGLMGLLNDGFFWLFMVLSYLSACYYWKKDWLASFRSWQQSQAAQLSLICLVFAGAHFVLFPAMWLRFFVATYLMAAISLLLLFHGQQQRSAMHVRSRAAQSTDRVGVSEMP